MTNSKVVVEATETPVVAVKKVAPSKKLLDITSKKRGKSVTHSFVGYNVEYSVVNTKDGWKVTTPTGVATYSEEELGKRGIMWKNFLKAVA